MVYPDNCRVQLIHPCPSHFAMCCNIPNRASYARISALGASLHSDSGRFAYQNPQCCFCSLQSRVYSRNPLRYHACPIISARTPGVELDSLSALEARSIILNFGILDFLVSPLICCLLSPRITAYIALQAPGFVISTRPSITAQLVSTPDHVSASATGDSHVSCLIVTMT